ncbi:NAD(P)-dependent oxidoreductase [Streptomyces sp. NPDC059002]|uniref:NAD(P)-dependent oxidoreductase n=1 Tax=Streptomyces sp. NPDC059002 TaxID=3346690 RepID=UPI0036BE4916
MSSGVLPGTAVRIAVLGATGMAGSRIVGEARARGHEVTAVARSQGGDVTDPALLDRVVGAADVVVSALPARVVLPLLTELAGPARAAGTRLVFVGGAGSLRLPAGERVIDRPDFREEWKPEASAHVELLDELRALPDEVEWTFLSPSALFVPGERTTVFRLGGENLLTGADGTSRISAEDYAIALLDEIESPLHRRQRFTVGY